MQETVNIKGTFDIARARILVRRKLQGNKHMSPFGNARITIAITALGELLIAVRNPAGIPVQFQVGEYDEKHYFEYTCSIPEETDIDDRYKRYQSNLERVSDSCSVKVETGEIQIEGRIQLSRNR